MTYAACSTTVADAGPDPADLQDLITDLARICHDRAVGHYRVDPHACTYRAFAAERGDRAAFAAFMEQVSTPPDDVATQLGRWDEAERAVAVVHWFQVELPA